MDAEDSLTLPEQGEEVLFHADNGWIPGEVIDTKPDGELSLTCTLGDESLLQRATHGSHRYGWLTYQEAAELKAA